MKARLEAQLPSKNLRVHVAAEPSSDWDDAAMTARDAARGIEIALEFATYEANPDLDQVDVGLCAWGELNLDLEGIFRRRDLVPFVLVPRDVGSGYDGSEKNSLFTHLQQAHEAFVFGLWFAAITLMRSVLEEVLRKHYGGTGIDIVQVIDSVGSLPRDLSRGDLHQLRKLANKVVHVNQAYGDKERDEEVEILSDLGLLRALIEGALEKR